MIHLWCVCRFLRKFRARLETLCGDLGASWMYLRWLNECLAQDVGNHSCVKTVLEAFGIHLGGGFGLLGRSWVRLESLLENVGAFWMDQDAVNQTCIKTVLEAFGIHLGYVFWFLGRSLCALEPYWRILGRFDWI